MRLVSALLLVLATTPVAAGVVEDEARQRALVLLLVIAYDHNLAARAGDTATLLVVYNSRDERSRGEHAAMRDGLAALEKLLVGGLPLRIVSEDHGGADTLRDAVARLRPAALYLCAGLGDQVESVSRITRAARVLSFAASEGYVRAGLSVAILSGGQRARVLINLAAARAEGVAFDAGLLKLAEVLR